MWDNREVTSAPSADRQWAACNLVAARLLIVYVIGAGGTRAVSRGQSWDDACETDDRDDVAAACVPRTAQQTAVII